MRVQRLAEMTAGWFVGDFEPAALRTGACEVAVKHYPAGAREERHVHRVARELTLVVSGLARMNQQELCAGEIACLEPGESADFEALAATVTVVVKSPSVPGDKFPA